MCFLLLGVHSLRWGSFVVHSVAIYKTRLSYTRVVDLLAPFINCVAGRYVNVTPAGLLCNRINAFGLSFCYKLLQRRAPASARPYFTEQPVNFPFLTQTTRGSISIKTQGCISAYRATLMFFLWSNISKTPFNINLLKSATMIFLARH